MMSCQGRAVVRSRPDVVVFLGDLLDGGRLWEGDILYRGVARFRSIFQQPSGVEFMFTSGLFPIT